MVNEATQRLLELPAVTCKKCEEKNKDSKAKVAMPIDTPRAERIVARFMQQSVLNENERGALVSLVQSGGAYYYNKQQGKMLPQRLFLLIRSGVRGEEVRKLWYNTAISSDGFVTKGLIDRRKAEYALFIAPI